MILVPFIFGFVSAGTSIARHITVLHQNAFQWAQLDKELSLKAERWTKSVQQILQKNSALLLIESSCRQAPTPKALLPLKAAARSIEALQESIWQSVRLELLKESATAQHYAEHVSSSGRTVLKGICIRGTWRWEDPEILRVLSYREKSHAGIFVAHEAATSRAFWSFAHPLVRRRL